jgi:phospholipid/cholesterol/gamma-HCH transport system substrate-binding protein
MEKFKFSKAQAIGLFVLLTLVAIFVVINFLKGQDLFNKNTKYYTTLQNVEGLTATGPVYIRGLKVGSVESIKYNNTQDNFIVKLSIKSDYVIPNNSVAEIYSADILGGKSVRIDLGNSNLHAKAGDTIKGGTSPDMITMLTKEIGPLKEQASALMSNMNTTLNTINALLDSNARTNLQQSFAHLNKTLQNAQNLSKSLNDMSPDLKEMIANLNTLSQGLSQGSGDIKNSLKNINDITTQISEADLKSTIQNLQSLLVKIQDPNGSLGKLLYTDSLHNSLDSLLKDVNNLVKKITENPKKYIKISVF